MMKREPLPDGRPVIFGEVLFDSFPDGQVVLGGAPFNVAWHLQGFGLQPLFLSRVGDDANGARVRGRMQEWGMDPGGLQTDPDHPTGTVQVHLENGQPRFDILPDQAYDHIEPAPAAAALAGEAPGLLYSGTLAARCAVSRDTLAALRGDRPGFVDVNLRPPWWRRAEVEAALDSARWAKLNDEELAALCGEAAAQNDPEGQAQALRARHGLELLVLTLGADGAWFVTEEGCLRGAPEPVAEVVDTVGAGDAFSAVTLLGLLRGWPLRDILARALEFAAVLCRTRGATLHERVRYGELLERWMA